MDSVLAQRPIKILVLIPTLEIGGAEMDLARNLPRLDRTRFDVIVSAFLALGPLERVLTDAGIQVIGPPQRTQRTPRRHPTYHWLRHPALRPLRHVASFLARLAVRPTVPRRWRGAAGYVRIGTAIAQQIRDHDIDIVHAVLPNSYAAAAVACALARGPKLVMSRVSLNWYHDGHPLFGFIERHILHRMIDAAICNSETIRRELLAEGIDGGKIAVVPNGIDMTSLTGSGGCRTLAREILGVGTNDFVLSVVGNLHPYKGHADLLHALHLIADRLPPAWTLLVPGRDIDGNLETLRRHAREWGIADHVRFLGARSDIPVILHAADLHVSASHTEGFPNNVLEAMAASVAVIATAVGGVPEMVMNDRTGLLVPPRKPNHLADAILQLAHDAERRRRLAEAGRRHVEALFSLDRSVAAFEAIYDGLSVRQKSWS